MIISQKLNERGRKEKDEEVGLEVRAESFLMFCQSHLLLGKLFAIETIMSSFMQALILLMQIFVLYIRE